MTSPHIFRAHNPADLIEYLPLILGFVPRESLVVGALEGPRRRVSWCLRGDIADICDDDDLRQTVVNHMHQTAPEQWFVVGCSQMPMVAEEAVDAMIANAGEPAPLIAVWSNDTHWWDASDECPPEGWPRTPDTTLMAFNSIGDDARTVWSSRAEMVAELVMPDELDNDVRRRRCEGVLKRLGVAPDLSQRVTKSPGTDPMADVMRRLRADPRSFDDAIEMAWLLRDESAATRWVDAAIDEDPAEMTQLHSCIARVVPDELAPGPLSALSFWAWRSGNGVVAAEALTRLESLTEHHPLGDLMRQILDRGVDPRTWNLPTERSENGESIDA